MAEAPQVNFLCPDEGNTGFRDAAIPVAESNDPNLRDADPDQVQQVAHALIQEKGAVLLMRDYQGMLVLPGGIVQPAESLSAALKRTALEVTGLQVKPVNGFRAFHRRVDDTRGRPSGFVARARRVDGEVNHDATLYRDALWIFENKLVNTEGIANATRRAFIAMNLGRLLKS